MSFSFETNTSETEDSFSNRYANIEAANKRSFYMNNPNRTLDVIQSIHSFGDARVETTTTNLDNDDTLAAARRLIAGGNMSPLGAYGPVGLSEEARIKDATSNMSALFESLGVPETSAYLLNPERDYTTPLTIVNIDAQLIEENTTWPTRLEKSGDFIYTRDPNKVLAVRPADCPVMIASADTPDGKVYMMVHYAWKGAANHYVEQTALAFDSLGVDRESLEMYLSPGAQAESYPYSNYPQNPLEEFPGTEGLFVKPTSHINEKGEKVWDFAIDTPKFVYDQVIEKLGVDPSQVFCDTSDTGSLESGYSSHGRSSRLKSQGEANTRDLVVAIFKVQ